MKISLIVSSILIINITILMGYGNGEEGKKEKIISWEKKANSLSYQGKYDEAIELHKKIIQMDPPSISSHLSLGYLYLKKGLYNEGIDEFEKVIIRASPSEFLFKARAYYGLGEIYLLKGDYRKAIQGFKASIKLFNREYGKNFPEVQKKIESHICSLLAEAYKKEGKVEDYKRMLNKSERLKQELNEYLRRESKVNKAKFYYEIANFFSCIEDYDQNFRWMRKAVSLDTSNPRYHFRMASIYNSKGLVTQAIEEYKQVFKTSPKNSTVSVIGSHMELGKLYTIQKRYDEAIQEFELSIKLSRQSEFPLFGNFVESESLPRLAILYKQKGELAKVEEIDKRIKELKFPSKEKIIKERWALVKQIFPSILMKDLLRIFISLAVILTFISLVYIIQRKRRKATEYAEVKWGIKEIVVSFLSSLILGGIIFISFYLTVAIQEEIISAMGIVGLYILLICFIIYYVKGKYKQSLRCIGLTREKLMRNICLGLAGGIGTIFLIIGVVAIIFLLASLLGGEVEKFVDEIMLPSSLKDSTEWFFSQGELFYLLLVLGLIVLVPLAEEMFFRGFIYAALRQVIGRRWAMVLSSLFFGWWRQEVFTIIIGFLVGLCLVYLYERTKSLIPCIVAHSFMQAGVLLLTYFFPS